MTYLEFIENLNENTQNPDYALNVMIKLQNKILKKLDNELKGAWDFIDFILNEKPKKNRLAFYMCFMFGKGLGTDIEYDKVLIHIDYDTSKEKQSKRVAKAIAIINELLNSEVDLKELCFYINPAKILNLKDLM